MPDGRTRSDDLVRREAADWVVLVHDGDVAVDRAAFERWRSTDPRHGEAYARAERAWEQASLLERTSFGRMRSLPAARPRMSVRAAMPYALAATILLACGLAVFVLSGARSTRQPGIVQIAAELGEIRRVGLADGSVLTLDTDSLVRVAFTSRERSLTLVRGRARFEVAHDAGAALRCETPRLWRIKQLSARTFAFCSFGRCIFQSRTTSNSSAPWRKTSSPA